jgi:TfoX/Sxy family transcriptional regulator of competence genes
VTAELATFVASLLGGDRVRAMFGGWAIYRDGEMLAIVYEGRTYLKATTEAAQARFIAAGMGPFRPRANQTFRTFWEIPPEVIHDAEDLAARSGPSE